MLLHDWGEWLSRQSACFTKMKTWFGIPGTCIKAEYRGRKRWIPGTCWPDSLLQAATPGPVRMQSDRGRRPIPPSNFHKHIHGIPVHAHTQLPQTYTWHSCTCTHTTTITKNVFPAEVAWFQIYMVNSRYLIQAAVDGKIHQYGTSLPKHKKPLWGQDTMNLNPRLC